MARTGRPPKVKIEVKEMSNEMYIKNCVEQFEKLLSEQYARAEKMKNAPPAIDYAKLDKIIIGCCGGDGIGPIITAEARRVLEYLLMDAVAAGKVELAPMTCTFLVV